MIRAEPRSWTQRERIGAWISPGQNGFTILEILLALAVLGLLSAVLVSGATHLVSGRPLTPEEVFWDASRQARRTALTSDREVRLSFDEKEKNFLVDDGERVKAFPLVEPPRELAIDFLPGQTRGRSFLIGGQLVESDPVKSVKYYPDGTCAPFRVQFHATGPARIIAIDPWTCAPVLSEKETP